MKRLLAISMLGVLAFSGNLLGDTRKDEKAAKNKYSREHRFVFYAILEGLYEDGVSDKTLKLIVPDPESMADPKHPEQTNFIPSCPLCTPAFDAFRVYQSRPAFTDQAETITKSFGNGLSKQTLAKLRGTPWERRNTIRDLIDKYISRRLDILALDVEDREDVVLRLTELKKEGAGALERVKGGERGEALKKVYADWITCPNCTGVSPDVEE